MDTLTAKPCHICGNQAYVEFEDVTVDADTFRVCDRCLEDNDGPGKFERENRDDESLALALVLYSLALDGGSDYTLTDEWQGSADQFGSNVLTVDHDGFVEVHSFRDADAAYRWINELEDDGFGATEDDAWISYTTNGITASLGTERLGSFETLRRAQAAVSVAMRKQGYYPNVFLSGEHGPTVRRIEVW